MDQNLLTVIISVVVVVSNIYLYSGINPKVVFLDVGQGDGIIFSVKNFQMIIDGGPGEELVSKIGRYMNNFDRRIEVLVITHWHADHYYGIYQILKEYSVSKIVLPTQLCKQNYEVDSIVKLIEKSGVEIVKEIKLDIYGVGINVSPSFGNECVSSSKEINNSSVVTSIQFNDLKILLMGDIEDDVESKYYVDSDILKAGHHCSDTSSSVGFLKNVSPLVVICSYGKNFYGHPSYEVLKRFKDFGVEHLNTYSNGDILVNLKSRLIYNQDNKLLMKL